MGKHRDHEQKKTKVVKKEAFSSESEDDDYKLKKIMKCPDEEVKVSKKEKQQVEKEDKVDEIESDDDSSSVEEVGKGESNDSGSDDSDSNSDSDSDSDSESDSSESSGEDGSDAGSDISLSTTEILNSDPLYTILSQFFISKNGNNIADILEEISQKLKYLKVR